MTQLLDRKLLCTDAGRAAVAQAWADGVRQKDIARCFGCPNSSPVCVAILEFLQRYLDRTHWVPSYYPDTASGRVVDGMMVPQGSRDRRTLVPKAITAYWLQRQAELTAKNPLGEARRRRPVHSNPSDTG